MGAVLPWRAAGGRTRHCVASTRRMSVGSVHLARLAFFLPVALSLPRLLAPLSLCARKTYLQAVQRQLVRTVSDRLHEVVLVDACYPRR